MRLVDAGDHAADAARRARTATRSCRRSPRGSAPRCGRRRRGAGARAPDRGTARRWSWRAAPATSAPSEAASVGRAGEQVVAGEDRDDVAPAGVDARDAAPGLGLVDHVVVVERAEVHELDRDRSGDRRRRRRADGSVGGVGRAQRERGRRRLPPASTRWDATSPRNGSSLRTDARRAASTRSRSAASGASSSAASGCIRRRVRRPAITASPSRERRDMIRSLRGGVPWLHARYG